MATKICKVCGNEYEYCHTFRRDTVFRWQDVACCIEHGNKYFAEIAASRGEVVDSNADAVSETDKIKVESKTTKGVTQNAPTSKVIKKSNK